MSKAVLNYLILIIFFVGGCSTSEQPTEIEKSIIEKEVMRCMVAVNTQRGIPDASTSKFSDGLDNLTGALASIAELADEVGNPLKNPTKKKWRVEGENDNRKITMSFSVSDKAFKCDFLKEDGQWKLFEVKRNNEVVFNVVEDREAKAENKRLGEELKAEKERLKKEKEQAEIKQWKEKSYSNVSYKYYEKRHINSTGSYGEPTLRVDCKPGSRPEVLFDDDSIMGKKSASMAINLKGNPEGWGDTFSKAVTSYGRIGNLVERDYSYDVSTDGSVSELLATMAYRVDSFEIEGFIFNFDDVSQVPCFVDS